MYIIIKYMYLYKIDNYLRVKTHIHAYKGNIRKKRCAYVFPLTQTKNNE